MPFRAARRHALLGRETEQDRIERLLAAARDGRSAVLVIRGEPGIGKSALLAFAHAQATDMTVLFARGLERESGLPFAGLSELLPPVLGGLSSVPPPQRVALESGLALSPASPGDRFAASAGVLSLWAAAAEHRPLLVLVDDLQWLDRPSAEAVLFAARRLSDEPVAVILAVREDDTRTLEATAFPEIRLGGLSPESAAVMLAAGGDDEVPPGVAERVCAAVAGNPLALLEARRLLTSAQLRGLEPLPDPLPLGASLENAYRRRIAELPASTRHALTVVAASGTGAIDEVEAALRAIGLDPSTLAQAESANVVSRSPERIEFRHPLLRSAAYQSASAPDRRAAHDALARALSDDRALGRRAWHRARAAERPDEDVAAELERAAIEAGQRGAPAAAADAAEVAARLSSDPERRARRLQQAGANAHLAGNAARAASLLAEALRGTKDPITAARIRHLRGQIELAVGSPSAARAHLLAAATALAPADPGSAALALADAAGTFIMECRAISALETAERAYALGAPHGGLPAQGTAVVLAATTAFRGRVDRSLELQQEARPLFDVAVLARNHWHAAGYALSRTWLDEDLEARRIIRRTVELLRASSALGYLPYALAIQSHIEFRLGNWPGAYAAAAESVRLAEETAQPNELAHSRMTLALVEAGYGRQAQCVRNAEAALATVRNTRTWAVGAQAKAALGLVELACGRPHEAAAQLDEAAELNDEVGEPTVTRSVGNQIEAHVAAGQLRSAERVLATLQEQAERTGGRWANAVAARCRGLLASPTTFEAEFVAALARHAEIPAPFETARTQLSFGERLRRARRPTDAREHLRAALRTFEQLGAAPWERRARHELDASGERRQPRHGRDIRALLTAQELQVALRVSTGATTKEAAAELFVSPRTVDAHLNRIYRKLGVRSRVELTRLMLDERTNHGPSGLPDT